MQFTELLFVPAIECPEHVQPYVLLHDLPLQAVVFVFSQIKHEFLNEIHNFEPVVSHLLD